MVKKKFKLKKNAKRVLIIIPIILIIVAISTFLYLLTGPNNKEKTIVINPSSIVEIGQTLEKENVIRSHKAFNIYMIFAGNRNLKAGTYNIDKHMGVIRIVKMLQKGSNKNPDELTITFKEGTNIRGIAKVISDNTHNSYDEIMEIMTDKSYINSLIDKYWFLNTVILDDKIYYPLEGYLAPNTYNFKNNEVTTKEIIETLLKQTDTELSKYKTDIENFNYSIHELLTLSSLVELEGKTADSRKDIAGVFYNRLNKHISLGSDVTTFYAFKIDDMSKGVTTNQLQDCTTGYNTRCSTFEGLPVGPITNPSIDAIDASLHPNVTNSLYFVADCDGNVYLSETSDQHIRIINKLEKEGKWCA